MTNFVPTEAQLKQLSREAKKIAREEFISHTAALDRLAERYGYKNWSLLARAASQRLATPPGADAASPATRRERVAEGARLVSQSPASVIATLLGHTGRYMTRHYIPKRAPSTFNDMRAKFNRQFEGRWMDESGQTTTPEDVVALPRIRPCSRCGEHELLYAMDSGPFYVQCHICGHRGPAMLANRSVDNWERFSLRAIIIRWNSEVVDPPATRAARRAKALAAVHASGEVPINVLMMHAERASTIMARYYTPTGAPPAPAQTDAPVKPGETEDD